MANDVETLHIVFSPSGAGLLRQAVRLARRKRDWVVVFNDFLSVGPINPPSPTARLRWFVNELGVPRDNWNWLPGFTHQFWWRASYPAARTIVWTSSRSADEHAAFLNWVSRCDKRRPYDVVDLANVEVTLRYLDGRTKQGLAISLGMIHADIIVGDALWDRARPLSADERTAHRDTWRLLRSQNAPLRVIGPDGLRSVPITYFDEILLANATAAWCSAVRVLGETSMHGDPDYIQSGMDLLAARLVTLIDKGKLEGRNLFGDGGHSLTMSTALGFNAEVRLPGA